MEGWGVMNAAHYENAAAIVVRGVSDMCAGKDHAKDKLHQPIAAAHAAAFAFSILSFRSKVPGPDGPMVDGETKERTVDHAPAEGEPDSEERRIDFIFNFEGSRESEENTSELQSLMRISYAVFCLKKKIINNTVNQQ